MAKREELVYALTVAGFDGSGGAGIMADIKTMAHFGVYGEAVCTALTVQNENEFVSPGWVPWDYIEAQLETLYKKRKFEFVKIGLVENAKVLKQIVDFVRGKVPEAFIIWDPIACASAGFRFMQSADEFLPVINQIDLVTPNALEYEFLGLASVDATAILLKGGHTEEAEAVDSLYCNGQVFKFSSRRLPGEGKHGTGCVLSSAILSNVAHKKTMPEACKISKEYMTEFMQSGEGPLGFLV